MAVEDRKSASGFWAYVVVAVVAGLALGGLIFSWIRQPPKGPAQSVTSTLPATTPSPQTAVEPQSSQFPARTAEPVNRRRAGTMNPPPQDDQAEGQATRGSSRSSTAAERQSAGPPMTERPALATPPVLISPTPGSPTPGSPVPIPAPPMNPIPPMASSQPMPAAYPSGRRRAVQETDSEAGTVATFGGPPSSDQSAGSSAGQGFPSASGRPSLNNRASASDGGYSSGRPVLHRAKSAEDTGDSAVTANTSLPPPLPGAGPPSARPAYNGPTSGTATWTGKLEKDGTLTISGGTPSTGVLAGAGLPGVPVTLIVDQSNLGFTEMPNAANGYRRVVLKSHAKQEKITFHWTVTQ